MTSEIIETREPKEIDYQTAVVCPCGSMTFYVLVANCVRCVNCETHILLTDIIKENNNVTPCITSH